MCTVESCLQYCDEDKLTHRTIDSFHIGILLTCCLWNAAADEQACYSKEQFWLPEWIRIGRGVILQSVWTSASHLVVRLQREMQKLQNEQLLPKINQFLCLLKVSRMGLSWCMGYKRAFAAEQSPCDPAVSLWGVCSCWGRQHLQLPQPKLEWWWLVEAVLGKGMG